MVYERNLLTDNPPAAIAKVFGFDERYVVEERRGVKRVENNADRLCLMCGRAQRSGYVDPKRALIGSNTNDFYNFVRGSESVFLCDYCHYCYKNYMKNMQKRNFGVEIGDMGNIVLFADRFEPKNFNSDENNELWDLFVEPPKEAFAVLIKKFKGNVFEFNAYRFLPTVSSETIVVNYGAAELFVNRKKTLRALDDFLDMETKHFERGVNFSEDVLFNRQKKETYRYWFTKKLRNDEEFMRDYLRFVNEYDEATRFVAKTMLKRHRKETKR